MVTLIPGSNWEHIGGKAHDKKAKDTIEARVSRLTQGLSDFILNPATNRMLRARITSELLW
jgi:hypothetical protein